MARYLVIQLARFGDLVQTKRLLRSLTDRGEVHLCLDSGLHPLAAMLYPDVTLHPLPVHGAPCADAPVQVRHCMAVLSGQGFDAVYSLNHSSLNRSLVRLFDPDSVRGYAMYGNQLVVDALVRLAFRWTKRRLLAPVNLVDFWAYFTTQPLPPHAVNPPAQGKGQGLGVVLAGRESRRSLPPQVLASCLHTAFEALGGPPVYFLGSATERPLARQLLRQLPGTMLDKVHDYCGKTDWAGLVEVLHGLDAVLTPDTGTMHLAAHLGVPVQAFFLSSAWCHETGPYGEGHTVWQSTSECAPCLESASCGIGTACLRAFEDRGLLRGLAASLSRHPLGKPLPQELTCQISHVDALGSTWRQEGSQDVQAQQRTALRHLMAEWLHVEMADAPPITPPEQGLVDFLYDDVDWMLPGRRLMEDA